MATELLAPAGTLEKLKWAAIYGADAVYFGVTEFSLRSYAGNFTMEDAQEGLSFLHAHGKKGFVTLNIYPFSDEYDALMQTAGALADMGADAFIVADLGAITTLQQMGLGVPIHVSTQANTVSAQTVQAYQALGATRVNLARELSLPQIHDIQRRIAGSGMETEVFIHGSVCFSYSGRCAISDYLTGRRANRGECTQSCRWNYTLMEEKRPGEFFPVFEDQRGLYLFNSKDLALFRYVPELVNCGVTSLKLEGRMKNSHYIAAVTSLYRRILAGETVPEEEIWTLLSRVSNRGYSEGFMKGTITPEDYQTDFGSYFASSVFIANTTEHCRHGQRVCDVKNSLNAGETLEMLTPDGRATNYTMPSPLLTAEGEELQVAQNHHKILLDASLPAYTIFRRVTEE
ncbi:MAG TPA: U32 family peptidase C-terminal domain-containing protein [Armatimonadota bacterium]|nr:U32 family peptidase C-terminal domain-containing protein [Armatimonadota bacterium]